MVTSFFFMATSSSPLNAFPVNIFFYLAVRNLSRELIVLLPDVDKIVRNIKTATPSEANTSAIITTDSPLGVDCRMLGLTCLVAVAVTVVTGNNSRV